MHRLLAACALLVVGTVAAASPGVRQGSALPANVGLRMMGHRGLRFEPNLGQADPRVKFLARLGGATLFVTRDEAALRLSGACAVTDDLMPGPRPARKPQAPPEPDHVIRTRLVGASRSAQAFGTGRLPGVSNYFIGNDPSRWRRNVPSFAKARLTNVYPNTDLVYYDAGGRLEYDFILKPGADPKRVAMQIQGADRMHVAGGDLVLEAGSRAIRWRKPVAYQEVKGRRLAVACRYEVLDGRVGFRVAAYDRQRPLVVDPVMEWATVLGGSGEDVAEAVAVHPSGDLVVVGHTKSLDFPVTSGSYQTSFESGTRDGFVTRLKADGSACVFSSYIGGQGHDIPRAVAISASGDIIVTGQAGEGYPTTEGAFDREYNGGAVDFGGGDIVVTKMRADGSGLVWSTYYGGGEYENGMAVATADDGLVRIAGYTGSSLAGPNAGGFDVVVAEFSGDGTALAGAKQLGGGENDLAYSMALQADGGVVVTGTTRSSDYPVIGSGDLDVPTPHDDLLLTRLTPDLSAITWSRRLGGDSSEFGRTVVALPSGPIVVGGFGASTDFPQNPVRHGLQGGGGDLFVLGFNSDGSGPAWASALGGQGYEEAQYMAVDAAGRPAMIGASESGQNYPTTPDAAQTARSGEWDAVISVLSADGSQLVWSSYLGGTAREIARGVCWGPDGTLWVAGQTASANFPATGTLPGMWARGGTDVFAAAFDLAPVQNHEPVAEAGANQQADCTGATASVPLSGASSSDPDGDDLTYDWFLGDVWFATGVSPVVSLPVGDHVITLKVTDGSGASSEDVVVITVRDSAAPTTARSVAPELGTTGWTNGPVAVTLSASDPGSGVKETKYRLGDGPEQPYTGPFVVEGEGLNPLAYWSVDNANNAEAEHTLDIGIDRVPPTTVPIISPAPNAAGWHKAPVTVTLNATDAGSGVTATQYSLDSMTWHPYNGPVSVTADGAYTVRFYSKDRAGNQEPEKTATFRIDSVPPATVLTCDPQANDAGWYNTPVALTLTATDDRSGVARTAYRLDGGDEQTYATPIQLSSDGAFELVYWSTDVADNVEQVHKQTIRIDTIPPVTEAVISPAPNAAGWHTTPVTVTLNATDAGSGVAETLYCVDGGTWLPYTAPVSVDADGKHTVSFYSKDRAGNTETAKPVLVWIDETPPVITIASPEPKTYIINEVVLAAFSATDATSGVATCEGTVPNGQPIDTAAPCSVTLEVTAHDFADNSAEQSVPYQITYGVMALYDQTKAHRPVGTVAIKIRLVDAAGANLSSPQIVVHAERVVRISDSAPGALEAPGDSNPDLNFRYDAALGGYLFNLKLSGYATGTYRLHFSVPGDPVDHTVEFQVK